MDDEQSIIEFLRREALLGHFESTTTEIADGIKASYNRVGRILERLIIKDRIGYRERGTERKSVRYYYLSDLLELYKERWQDLAPGSP